MNLQTGLWTGLALLLSPVLLLMALAIFTLFGGSQELAGGLSWFAIVAIFTTTPIGMVILVITGFAYRKKARSDDKDA